MKAPEFTKDGGGIEMQLTGAELLVQCLVDRDVDVLFGYPGGAVLDIYDALYDRKELKVIRTSHEQGATHAADGYARSTGKTGVVIATSGPGATNLVTGIATAYMDSVPMVCITGNVSQNLAGRNAFQEVDIASITLSVTKHNFVVRKVEELQDTVTRAFAIANSGRKGPVLIDILKDVLQASVSYDAPAACEVENLEKVDEADLDRLAELIRKAKKPMIYSGGGVTASESFRELRKLIDRCKIPAVHTIMGIGVLGYEDELNLSMVGMHGRVSSNMAIDECDLLIGVGVRFSDRVALNAKRFAAKAIVVQMDVDPSEIAKNVDVDLSLLGDLKDALNRLVEKLEPMEHRDWQKKIRGFKEEDFVPVKEGILMNGGTPILIPSIGVCDGIAMGHEGMKYSLPSRELIADSVETMAVAHALDALVLVPNCDKIVPGMIMGALRLNLPTVVVSGGPMLAGKGREGEASLSKVFEAVGSVKGGTMSEEELRVFEKSACPSCGSCAGMYTANSMNCLSEAVGLALPGNGTIPAVYAERRRLAKESGFAVMELLKKDVRIGDVFNTKAVENAITCDMALGVPPIRYCIFWLLRQKRVSMLI